MEFKWIIVLLLQTSFCIVVRSTMTVNGSLSRDAKVLHKSHIIRSIKSEDGDIIDCIDIYKQPAFDHPALRDHKIQLSPSEDAEMETQEEDKRTNAKTVTTQTWQKSGSCPKGTIPVRRMQKNNVVSRKPVFNEAKTSNLLGMNTSRAILLAYVVAFHGAKADIKVWNPYVEKDDEFSKSHVALQNGRTPLEFEAVESGWAVNPRVYGDRKTRLYVYWTADGNHKTGCFDITCPGFVQTSHEIALGAAIYPISNPNGLPYQITLYVHQDPNTYNWWVTYGEKINIGYFPAELFVDLSHHASTVEWGGEVYSSRVGEVHPHTRTEMGSGRTPDPVFQTSGTITRMRVRGNDGILRYPQWVSTIVEEFDCYQIYLASDYVEDPEFYYGGAPGRTTRC